ncbi:hypothetical protein F5Y16DRAFT_48701 [Xylariaceae sp. FL0255]|nr:hypothetical protein F5Y16DRAFT_48701 [Xylariaceae sp. FL0255]
MKDQPMIQPAKRVGAATSMPAKKSRLRSPTPCSLGPRSADAFAPTAMASPSLVMGETTSLGWDYQAASPFAIATEPSHWVPANLITSITPVVEDICMAASNAAIQSTLSHIGEVANFSNAYIEYGHTNDYSYAHLSYKDQPQVSIDDVSPWSQRVDFRLESATNLESVHTNSFAFLDAQPCATFPDAVAQLHSPTQATPAYDFMCHAEHAQYSDYLGLHDDLGGSDANQRHDDEALLLSPENLITAVAHIPRDPSSPPPSKFDFNEYHDEVDDADAPPQKQPPMTKPKPKASRKEPSTQERNETNQTRRWKACIRCKIQKIRCEPNTSNDQRLSCKGCSNIHSATTKKIIHRIPCLRWSISDTVLFRAGGLGLTKRWVGVRVEDIPPHDWKGDKTFTIDIGVSLLPEIPGSPMKLVVRQFIEADGDELWRHHKNEEGKIEEIVLPAYALANVTETIKTYQDYITENAEVAIRYYVEDEGIDELVKETFSIALKHFHRLKSDSLLSKDDSPTKTSEGCASLFDNYFKLWFATRFTLGYAYISDGYEQIGILDGHTHCNNRRVSFLPRMITAQLDSIAYKYGLMSQKKTVLDLLWTMMQKRSRQTFFTVYLIVFMILHEISVCCGDRHRRARDKGLKELYDLPEVTEKIKHGANIILGYWHYFKGGLDPLSVNEKALAKAIGNAADEEVALLMKTCQRYRQMKTEPACRLDWQNLIHVVGKMFEASWDPGSTT